MDEVEDLLLQYNELRYQVYEAELRVQSLQAKEYVERTQIKPQVHVIQENTEKQFEMLDDDQLNKITLALSNSATRIIKDLYYDEEKGLMVVQLQEQGMIIELELKNKELERIKLQQIGRRDQVFIDRDNLNFDSILAAEDQPFSALIVPFLQKLELM